MYSKISLIIHVTFTTKRPKERGQQDTHTLNILKHVASVCFFKVTGKEKMKRARYN